MNFVHLAPRYWCPTSCAILSDVLLDNVPLEHLALLFSERIHAFIDDQPSDARCGPIEYFAVEQSSLAIALYRLRLMANLQVLL